MNGVGSRVVEWVGGVGILTLIGQMQRNSSSMMWAECKAARQQEQGKGAKACAGEGDQTGQLALDMDQQLDPLSDGGTAAAVGVATAVHIAIAAAARC